MAEDAQRARLIVWTPITDEGWSGAVDTTVFNIDNVQMPTDLAQCQAEGRMITVNISFEVSP